MEGTSEETTAARSGRGLCVPANDETQPSMLPQMLEPEPDGGGRKVKNVSKLIPKF
jgi:hypothetical protein